MTIRRSITLTALTTLTLLAVACGSDDDTNPGAAEPTTTVVTDRPPTTDAPTTDAPTTDAPTTDAPTTEPEPTPSLPANPVVIDDGAFTSIEEMAAASELIVVGTVTKETSLGRPHLGARPDANEYVGITVAVDEVLKGEPLEEVLLERDAYVVDENGRRIAENVFNGVPVPDVGDRLVLFLNPVDEQSAHFPGGFPSHTPVMIDGVGFLEGKAITIADDSSPLVGTTLDQITAAM
jgi:hypothetical protein